MLQKIIKIGSSIGVTIPKKYAEQYGLRAGEKLLLSVDKKQLVFSVPKEELSSKDESVARIALSFINRYRKDLEALKDK